MGRAFCLVGLAAGADSAGAASLFSTVSGSNVIPPPLSAAESPPPPPFFFFLAWARSGVRAITKASATTVTIRCGYLVISNPIGNPLIGGRV